MQVLASHFRASEEVEIPMGLPSKILREILFQSSSDYLRRQG